MINFLKEEIPFLKECSKIELINKGLSYASVFKIYKEQKIYILKIYKDNKINRIEVINRYINTNQIIPEVIEYGKTPNLDFYIIMEYIKSGTLEENYKNIPNNEIFKKAKKLGQTQKVLSEKYITKEENFFETFKESELKKYEQTVDLINKYKHELPQIDIIKIKQDMERLIEFFRYDKYFYMHFDLKADNVMLDKELLMIDYENTTSIYLPIALRCEIYHIMNNDEKSEKSKEFIKGVISGIEEEQIKDSNLNKKLAYAYLKSAFVYIVGYLLKNNRINEAKIQIEKIDKVYSKCENIESLIGNWK